MAFNNATITFPTIGDMTGYAAPALVMIPGRLYWATTALVTMAVADFIMTTDLQLL